MKRWCRPAETEQDHWKLVYSCAWRAARSRKSRTVIHSTCKWSWNGVNIPQTISHTRRNLNTEVVSYSICAFVPPSVRPRRGEVSAVTSLLTSSFRICFIELLLIPLSVPAILTTRCCEFGCVASIWCSQSILDTKAAAAAVAAAAATTATTKIAPKTESTEDSLWPDRARKSERQRQREKEPQGELLFRQQF